MSTYLFSGLVNAFQEGRCFDACTTLILYGKDGSAFQEIFEDLLLKGSGGEAKILKILCAPVLDELLTESGPAPIDWARVGEEVLMGLEATTLDDSEQGYWLDCDQYIRPDHLAASPDALERELPEEVRSGLNWSDEKVFFFLVTALAQPPAEPVLEQAGGAVNPEEGLAQGDTESDSLGSAYSHLAETFPNLAATNLGLVVRARNAAIAAWLWRRRAAGTEFASNAIRIQPLCELVGIGTQAG